MQALDRGDLDALYRAQVQHVPARLVTGLITERGVCAASREGLLSLFPERRERGAA